MASRNKSTGRKANTPQSEDDYILGRSDPASARSSFQLLSPVTPLDPLVELEDRRTFHPLGPHRAARFTAGSTARDRQASRRQKRYGFRPRSQTKAVIAFANPDAVVLCVRRKRRREVLFAKRKYGAGGGRRPRHRNWTSRISCK